MAHLLLLLLLSPSIAGATTRMLAEGVQASSTTLFIDTANVRVGISTGIPKFSLDVNGQGNFQANGANTYSIITGSGVYVSSGGIAFGATGSIRWADGSVSTTASSGSGGGGGTYSINYSSQIFATSDAGTNSTFITCLTNSTMTLVTGANAVMIDYAGSARADGDNIFKFTVILDGGIINSPNLSTTRGMIQREVGPTANEPQPFNVHWVTPKLTAGTHNFCFAPAISAGTWTSSCADAAGECIGSVMELK